MSQSIDYDSDVLKFKQVWDHNQEQRARNAPEPKNLQTIQSNSKNIKKSKIRKGSSPKTTDKKIKNQNKGTKQFEKQQEKTKSKSKSIYSNIRDKTVIRNVRLAQDVIEVQTSGNKFYQSDFQNQKAKICQSHLILGQQSYHHSKLPMYPNDRKYEQESKDHQLSMLRVVNSKNQDRIRFLQKQLKSKNLIIDQLHLHQHKISKQNCQLYSKQLNFDYGKVQYQNFRNDSKRLLKMLQSTNQYKVFSDLAIADDGVRFLNNVGLKSKIDTLKNNSNSIHFCTCNKVFIPESSFWVPQKIYAQGKEFVKNRNGEAVSQTQMQLLLYELNKVWRERQKRIINTLTAEKSHEVSKYKRKIQNLSHRHNKTSRNSSKAKQQEQIEQ